MNKQAYLVELNGLLTEKNITDVDEIIAEYDEHFARKMADGFSEEEIAKRLGSPKEVAAQFASEKTGGGKSRGIKAIITTGLVFVDIAVVSVFVAFYAWVVALGASAFAGVLGGLTMLLEPVLPAWVTSVPYMPYFGQVFMAVAMLGIGVLFWVATVYCATFTSRIVKAYFRWHSNLLKDEKRPPVVLHPMFSDRRRRRYRSMVLISLVVFGVMLVVGYIILAVSANALEFWHVWNWFV